MDKLVAKAIRDLHKSVNENVILFCDNAKLYNENLDKIIWDDTSEDGTLHVIRTNVDYRTSLDFPISIESFDYTAIQYISSIMDINKLRTFLAKFVQANILTAPKANEIIEYFAELTGSLINPTPGSSLDTKLNDND